VKARLLWRGWLKTRVGSFMRSGLYAIRTFGVPPSKGSRPSAKGSA
jgi:hypothetical protein